MKTIKQQNMDLDLRRFGHNLYTEALNNGNSGEVTGKTGINEGLKKMYEAFFPKSPDGSSIVDTIQFPDAFAYKDQGDRQYYILEDSFVSLVEKFASNTNVYPLYKNPPYAANTMYEVKDSDNSCLFSPKRGAQDLFNPYLFFQITEPYNEDNPYYYDTNIRDVNTESGTESYYALAIWEKES